MEIKATNLNYETGYEELDISDWKTIDVIDFMKRLGKDSFIQSRGDKSYLCVEMIRNYGRC